MGTESGAAAAGSSTPEKEGSLWSILPSFDPQQDDPREYRDKITFLHGICPKKDDVGPETGNVDEGDGMGTGEAH
jgi:hypothetical protein